MNTTSCRLTVGSAVILGACISSWCLAEGDAADSAKSNAAVPTPKITVSKETTWVTEPLRADGTVDYFEAVNQFFGKGVTPENNACVLLYQAMGPSPSPEGSRQPDAFFRRMGVEPLPENGKYFQSFDSWVSKKPRAPQDINAVIDMKTKSCERPWTKAEFPLIAEWLKDNEAPLRTVTLATQRHKYFSPVVRGTFPDDPDNMLLVRMSGAQCSGEMARALASRAMCELAEGRPADAWRDLMTMHRLGRLVGQGCCLIEHKVGEMIESDAILGELQFLSVTKPTTKMLAVCRKQLDHLPPRSSPADKVDYTERMLCLNSVQQIASRKMDVRELHRFIVGETQSPLVEKLAEGAVLQTVDWDAVLTSVNTWHDRLAAILRKPDYRDGTADMKQLNDDLKKVAGKCTGSDALLALQEKNPPNTQMMADALIWLLLPADQQSTVAEGCAIQRTRNLEVAFALAAHRADHGSYPDSLESLAPKYSAHIPTDLFAAQPLKYTKIVDGYRLYSVGPNEQDEDGRSGSDNPPGDDIAVQMTAQLATPAATQAVAQAATPVLDIVGTYRRTPVENGFHEGAISVKPGSNGKVFEWTNKSNVSWNLFPDFSKGVMQTDKTNPYFESGGKECTLVVKDGKVTGFVFLNETYDRD